MAGISTLRTEKRKQNNVPNRWGVRKEHDQPVKANPLSGCGRHAVFQRPHIIIIDGVGGVVTGISSLRLLKESLLLICGIVQLRKSISQLSSSDIQLKAIDQGGVRVIFSRQRGHLQRIPG